MLLMHTLLTPSLSVHTLSSYSIHTSYHPPPTHNHGFPMLQRNPSPWSLTTIYLPRQPTLLPPQSPRINTPSHPSINPSPLSPPTIVPPCYRETRVFGPLRRPTYPTTAATLSITLSTLLLSHLFTLILLSLTHTPVHPSIHTTEKPESLVPYDDLPTPRLLQKAFERMNAPR